ncbi:hypothetical protein PR202_gb19660 [Eleusine coracana subsp. coracana]|uniref:Uncharacterized protein n=1 Tax=Eleusine coracana subsp. coracana TaxID=191504 RepID=A0AAV5F8S2_ELECO|nr:hypothetical protein PR202_gb19660 [Eleusine coracana subsp. coracana]
MARHLAPASGSLHRLLASRHYPPASPAPPLRPLLLPKAISPAIAAAMQFPRRGQRDVAAASAAAPAPSSPETEVVAWGKVSAVLFDMDGVLCNSEEPSRQAAVDVFAEMGVEVTVDDFVPFMGTGEANFLGGVARVKGVKDFDPESVKKRFFEIYLDKYAKPNSGIGFPGALELIMECKNAGLKIAVASSADRIKVDANLAAAGLPVSLFDTIVSADAFENLKPSPDIFLAASKNLDVDTNEITGALDPCEEDSGARSCKEDGGAGLAGGQGSGAGLAWGTAASPGLAKLRRGLGSGMRAAFPGIGGSGGRRPCPASTAAVDEDGVCRAWASCQSFAAPMPELACCAPRPRRVRACEDTRVSPPPPLPHSSTAAATAAALLDCCLA